MIRYAARERCETTYRRARDAGLPELTANVVARRVAGFDGALGPLVDPSLRHLPDPATLPDVDVATARLVRALREGELIGIVTDYDVDGITAHTLLREALVDAFGHPAQRLRAYIGHRLKDGYGLSDNLCARILAEPERPAVLITADCGTSDGPRIARLAQAGIDTLVTDHHGVPDEGAPAAALATVNPSRRSARFADPAIAGCTVAWLLMGALRRALIEAGALAEDAPKLAMSLDLVALGTVADAVSLFSPTNRAVVLAGLAVMNRRARPCWQALAALLGRGREPFTVEDLGFQIGPRINARGRVADPFAALNFLTATTEDDARRYLAILDADNQERRDIEKAMVVTARRITGERLRARDQVVCVYDEAFHPGVQGIVASRLVEAYGRVSVVLSPAADPALVTGSLRSVQGVDIARALREVAGANEGLLERFGGHPKAAGVTLTLANLPRFESALADAVRAQLGDARLTPVLWHDGELAPERLCLDTVRALAALEPYGRGFEPPRYHGTFVLAQVRAVGADPVHLSLEFEGGASRLRGIWFRALESAGSPWPVEAGQEVACTYRLSADDYRGGDAVQLIVAHARALR